MSSLQHPLPPPPSNTNTTSSTPTTPDSSPSSHRTDPIYFRFANEALLSWCIGRHDRTTTPRKRGFGVPALLASHPLVVSAAAFVTASAALVLIRSMDRPDIVVNILGFACPALATIVVRGRGEASKKVSDKDSTSSSAYAGYWVLFGMYSAFDSILPAFTPSYFCTKACVLAWGVYSPRPCGGRRFLRRLFFMSDDDDSDNEQDSCTTISEKPATMKLKIVVERAGRLVGLPPKTLRLAWITAMFATGTIALGVCFWSVSVAEAYFSKLSKGIQNGVCVLVGAPWPLYATLVALGRADAARQLQKGDRAGQRQGPAAVQWLSYWPIFALFAVFVDPVAGWIPHYYSVKLVALAVLAFPQTRGAYLVTSCAFGCGEGVEEPVIAGGNQEEASRCSHIPSDDGDVSDGHS